MASYKAVTADEVYMRGGTYNGETGSDKIKCVRYADRTTWCQNHGCTFNKVTNLNYSANSVLAIEDIMINSQQQEEEPVVVNKRTLTIEPFYESNFTSKVSELKRMYNVFRVQNFYFTRDNDKYWIENGDMNIPLSLGIAGYTHYSDNDTYRLPNVWQGKIIPETYSSDLDNWTLANRIYYGTRSPYIDYSEQYSNNYDELKINLSKRIDIYFHNDGNGNPYNISGKRFNFVIGENFHNTAMYLEHNQQYWDGVQDDTLGIGWNSNMSDFYERVFSDSSRIWDKLQFDSNSELIPVLEVNSYVGRRGFSLHISQNSNPKYYEKCAICSEQFFGPFVNERYFIVILHNCIA